MLVVSDDAALIEVATEWAHLRGLHVAVTRTVAEASRWLRRSRPALTLCGARLSDGPGTALVVDLLAVHDDALAIMVCPAEPGTAIYECLCSGALDVAVWPFDSAGLDELVRAALERIGRDLIWAERTAGISVLCVEDDPITLRFTGKLLDTFGVKAHLVPSLLEARRALERELPDLVLIDLFLNAESGLELLAELRSRLPWLPVIVVTASQKVDVLLNALRAGAAAVLVKPLERERLRTIITQLFRTKKHREALGRVERALRETRQELDARLATPPRAVPGTGAHPLADAVNALPSGVLLIDASGVCAGFNRAGEEILGLQEEPVLGKRLEDVPVLAPLAVPIGTIQKSRRQLLRGEAEVTIRSVLRTIRYSVAPVSELDPERGWVISLEDITSRRAVEREHRRTEKLATLGMIASSFVEEVSSPVDNASTTVELVLRDPAMQGKSRLGLERMKLGLQRVSHFARQVSRLLATDEGARRCDVHQILGESLRFAERRFLMGSVRLSTALNAGWPLVTADPTALEYLFMLVLLGLSRDLPAGDQLEVVTVNQMAVLEIRFWSASSPPGARTAPETGGVPPAETGLSYARVIARRAGGAMRVEERMGCPWRVTLRLPCPTAEERREYMFAGDQLPRIERLDGAPPFTVGLVVALDDVAELCAGWIRAAGMTGRRFESSARALTGPAGGQPDALVIDMVGIGLESLQLLQQLDAASAPAVVLLLEDGVSLQQVENLEDLARRFAVPRPLSAERLIQAIALADLRSVTAPDQNEAGPEVVHS